MLDEAPRPKALAGRRRWAIGLSLVAIAAGLMVLAGFMLLRPTPAAPRPLPPFTMSGTSLDGKPVSGADFAGHPLVVNFWASWCGTCYEEQPGINAAVALYQPRGVQFLGIDIKDNNPGASFYQQRFHNGYPSIFDSDNRIGYLYDISSPPSWLFIDAKGMVVRRVEGGLHDADLRKLIDDLLLSGGAQVSQTF